MDVYDFDGTLFRGDSTALFYLWCVRRHPRVAATVPRTSVAAVACLGLKRITRTQFKQALYRFLPHVPDIQLEVALFWNAYERRIEGPCNPQPGDLVISAGPEFLLHDVCERRGLQLIASQVDSLTGRVLGPNCQGPQKVERLHDAFPNAEIDRFYSDSRHDDPLAALAREAYLVDIPKGRLRPWPIS